METIDMVRHPTAEETVVAGLMNEDLAPKLADLVKPEYFESEVYQVIVEGSKRLLRGHEPYDLDSIAVYCKRVLAERKATRVEIPRGLLESLAAKDTRRSLSYAITVQAYAQCRELHHLFQEGQEAIVSTLDPVQVRNDILSRIREITVIDPDQKERFVHGDEAFKRHQQELRQREADYKAGNIPNQFPWPEEWPSWSERIGGSRRVGLLQPGMAGCIFAAEKVGKTGYLECVAEGWAKAGRKVLFVHCENDERYTINRRTARYSGVPLEKIEEGSFNEVEKRKIDEAQRKIAQFKHNLHYMDGDGATMDDIYAEVERRVKEDECEAVIIDYFQMIGFSRGQLSAFRGNKTAMEEDNVRIFRRLPLIKSDNTPGIVAFTASQLSKHGKRESDMITGEDGKGTSRLPEAVQLNIGLKRPILKADKKDFVGNVIVRAGERDDEVTVNVISQNRGGSSMWKQIYIGPRFDIKDKPR